MNKNFALIVGGGPAGLTAAYEILNRTDMIPVVFEASNIVGGISRTVNYKGNRIDMGGHRFFTKSDRVMDFWTKLMPIQTKPSLDDILLGRNVLLKEDSKEVHDPQKEDNVMLIRNRVSRIYYNKKFFDYPVKLNFNTIKNLGAKKIFKIGFDYILSQVFPVKNEKNLEDFFINRFGKELYETFFKDYTEKVWGIECKNISKDWGAQRVKGLSLSKTVLHAISSLFKKRKDIYQKDVETTLIERFLYPKYGPGHFWERVAKEIENQGGKVLLNKKVVGIEVKNKRIISLFVEDTITHKLENYNGEVVLSSMPIRDLAFCMKDSIDKSVFDVAEKLKYRDFITVGLLLKKLKIKNETKIPTLNNIVPDNWIYIQEKEVKAGRLQIFNNWSPYMVSDLNKVWIGVEYFCTEGDEFWNMSDNEIFKLAIEELEKIGIIDINDVEDGVVLRLLKAYPVYFGDYRSELEVLKEYFSTIENLFLIGRNGMHRYNNMDHSMLTAMVAVDNFVNNIKSKENIWEINVEEEYHEEK